MALFDRFKTTTNHEGNQDPLGSVSLRDTFFEWLLTHKTNGYSETAVFCMDKVSEYALRKKVSSAELWSISKSSEFRPIYQKLMNAKLLRLTDRHTYHVFIGVGQLYMQFLTERTLSQNPPIPESVVEEALDESVVVEAPGSQTLHIVDPERVIAWLVTQENAFGKLYSEDEARKYMNALRTAPAKLNIFATLTNKSVFALQSPEEVNSYWRILRTSELPQITAKSTTIHRALFPRAWDVC